MATVTVLSGPERRRRWSRCEKKQIVEESLVAGAAVTLVARRHDVHPNLLHHWRRQAKQAVVMDGGLKLLPVALSGSPGVKSRAEGLIEIELVDARVRVDAGVDEAALGRVLRVLRALGTAGR
jgi:transposase